MIIININPKYNNLLLRPNPLVYFSVDSNVLSTNLMNSSWNKYSKVSRIITVRSSLINVSKNYKSLVP